MQCLVSLDKICLVKIKDEHLPWSSINTFINTAQTALALLATTSHN